MRKTMYKLITNFANKIGIQYSMEEGEVQATITVEDMDIQIGLREDKGLLLFQTGVGFIPTDGKEEFFRMILAEHASFSLPHGFFLGLDENLELITLQMSSPLLILDDEAFEKLMEDFIQVTADWLIALHEWRPSAPQGDSMEGMAMQSEFFLKI